MSAIFINIQIDNEFRFENFKTTFMDIAHIFDSAYVKFRGEFAEQCLLFIESNFKGNISSFQDIQESDWLESSIIMIEKIKDRSVFIYLEDHRIVSNNNLKDVLDEFDSCELDYLNYTYFNSSMLKCENLLPLSPIVYSNFDSYNLTKKNKQILSMISPAYCVFSLASISSVEYFKMVLSRFSGKKKIYNKYFSILLMMFISYPLYRIFLIKINKIFRKIKVIFQLYPINTPFNTEMIMDDYPLDGNEWKLGVLHEELFADSDDDNGHYGSSLLKRGLYPFNNNIPHHYKSSHISINRKMKKGQVIDYKYNSPVHRVYEAPVLNLLVNKGEIKVENLNNTDFLSAGLTQDFLINKGIHVTCIEDSSMTFNIYDESFKKNIDNNKI